MGRYDAPPNPYEEFTEGCIRVYFPDNPFLFRALMGQLTELESRFRWDTGGDIAAAEKLEQDWLSAGEKTRQFQDAGCPDTEDCQQTIIDLTIQLEQCQNELQELEDMDITVNCNCGCCGGDYPLPVIEDPTQTPIELVPVNINPDDPFGEDVPEWDDITQTPPPGFTDWQDFLDSRCLMSNYAVDAFLETARKLDEAENKASVLVDIASLLLLFAPIPVGKTKGFLTAVKWVAKVAAFLDITEEAFDWLQWIEEIVTDNRDDFVCWAYQATSAEAGAEQWASQLTSMMSAYPAIAALTVVARDAIIDAMTSMARDFAPMAQDAVARFYVPSDYVATFDCINCLEIAGYDFTAGFVSSVDSLAVGSGISGEAFSMAPGGVSVNITGTTTAADRTLAANLEMVTPAISGDWRYVGMTFKITGTNIGTLNIFQYNPGAGSLWDTNEYMPNEGIIHLMRDVATDYPDTIQGVTEVNKSTSINIDTCTLTASGIRLGIRTGGAGAIDFTISDFQWVRKLDRAC